MRKVFDCPMPEFIGWEIDTLEKLEAAEFDDPYDRRRYFSAGDNQIAGVGDGFERNSPPWVDTVKSLWPDFPVYGSMTECSECMTRLIGPQNHMMWIALEPERMAAVLHRVGQFYLDCAKAAIDAAGPWLDGFVIWGDVAYKKGTFMQPDYWRKHYKPWVKAIADHAHAKGLDVIYHGCGNINAIFEDYIDIGIDAYESAGGQGGHGRARPAAALRPPHGLLRQQRHPGVGDGRPRGHPPRGAAQAQRGPRRRLHLPVRPFRVQLGVRARPTTTSSSSCASTGGIRCNSASLSKPFPSHNSHLSRPGRRAYRTVGHGSSHPFTATWLRPPPPQAGVCGKFFILFAKFSQVWPSYSWDYRGSRPVFLVD